MFEKSVTNRFVNGYAGKSLGLDFTEFLSQFVKQFFMLVGLGIGLVIFKKLIEIYKIGVIEKIWVKDLSINVLQKIILAFFLNTLESK